MALRRLFGGMARKPITPQWQKMIYRDPFDYPLRSIEEVKREIKEKPPVDQFLVEMADYRDADIKNDDPRNAPVKVTVNMNNWHLTSLQRKRLIFLLGSRYKEGSQIFRVVSRQFDTREQNMQRCKDILTELFLECKRAP